MTRFGTVTDTGDPIAVLKACRYQPPWVGPWHQDRRWADLPPQPRTVPCVQIGRGQSWGDQMQCMYLFWITPTGTINLPEWQCQTRHSAFLPFGHRKSQKELKRGNPNFYKHCPLLTLHGYPGMFHRRLMDVCTSALKNLATIRQTQIISCIMCDMYHICRRSHSVEHNCKHSI